MVAILGLAGSRLARPRTPTAQGRTRAARHVGANLNEAVLPLYVLHETVVVAVAYAVLSWPVAAGVQYLAISLTRWPARWPCMSSVSAAPGHPGAVRPQAPRRPDERIGLRCYFRHDGGVPCAWPRSVS